VLAEEEVSDYGEDVEGEGEKSGKGCKKGKKSGAHVQFQTSVMALKRLKRTRRSSYHIRVERGKEMEVTENLWEVGKRGSSGRSSENRENSIMKKREEKQ
jgi:hypothetical protein